MRSGYLGETHEAVVGAERFVYSDEEGEQGVHERIERIDHDRMQLRFKIYEARDLPIDTEVSFGESHLTSLGDEKTLFQLRFVYRTSPRFLAHFANGRIEEDLGNMLIGMEHYLATGEEVTADNFEAILEAATEGQ